MLWAMDLYHRRNEFLISPDYFSRLGLDLCFNELTRLYFSKTEELEKRYPPVTGAMKPENMPGFRPPRIRSDLSRGGSHQVAPGATAVADTCIVPIMTSILMDRSGGHELCLQVVPILTGYWTPSEQSRLRHIPFHNHEIAVYAAEVTSFFFCRLWL